MTWFLYLAAGAALAVSAAASREKTKKALNKAWNSFLNVLPALAAMLFLVSISVALLPERVIASLIGEESGFLGQILASFIGSLTLIPGFVAFPLVAALLHSGAGYMQVAAFVSTLMMVGVVTIPLEISYFGKRAAWMRNAMAFVFSLLVDAVVGGLMK